MWHLGPAYPLPDEDLRHAARTAAPVDRPPWPAPRETLSDDQRAAVEHPHGPARVLAPAGAGKTRVLAARLRHLVLDRGVDPGTVTALAYNTRAAAELVERTRDVMRDGRRPQVRTLHALGLAICTSATSRSPRMLGEADALRLISALLALPLRTPALHAPGAGTRGATGPGTRGTGGRRTVGRVRPRDPRPYLAALTEVRLGLQDPVALEQARGDVPGLPTLVARYRTWLATRGWLDHDEQVHRAVELLLADPVLRARVRAGAVHLLVDEAQDLTPLFLLLVRVLAGPAREVFAVGDDDQTIYGYAGAAPEVLVDFSTWFPGAADYRLGVNHRCPAPVVDAANALLAHNRQRVPKVIRAARAVGADSELQVLRVAPAEQAHQVLTHVTAALAKGRSADEIAVLARVSTRLLSSQVRLRQAGIACTAIVGPEVLQRVGLRTALAHLALAVNPQQVEARMLADALRRPQRVLPEALLRAAAPTSIDGLVRLLPQLDVERRATLHAFLRDLQTLIEEARAGADTARLLTSITVRLGLGAALDAQDARSPRQEGSSHGDDLAALRDIAPLEPDPTRFGRWLHTQLTAHAAEGPDAAPPPGPAHRAAVKEAVTLSTVHRVKGREWPEVVIVGLDAGVMPHRLSDDPEEERRILHVAITRAQRRLTLISDRTRPSPFLPELLGELRAAPVTCDPQDLRLLAALKAWRRETAAAAGLPAFLIAHDRTLAGVVARRPMTPEALRTCRGIGPVTAERYGAAILRMVRSEVPRTTIGSGRAG